MSTLNGLGQERTVCPEAKIVERPFLAKGTAKVRAESGKRRARFRTEEGSLAGAHGLHKGWWECKPGEGS